MSEKIEENIVYPAWEKIGVSDKYGNVACKVCGKLQAPLFRACIYCCDHEILELKEEWHSDDDYGGWELEAYCSVCGKNLGFSNEELIQDYKLVKIRKAPWADYKGNPIHEGDTIVHPSGEFGIVVYLSDADDSGDQWRVKYDGVAGVSRLCLQVGDKGRAVVRKMRQ